jgi:hypothetical protein
MTKTEGFSMKRWSMGAVLALLSVTIDGRAAPAANVAVSVARTTMNPTLGEAVPITVRLEQEGTVDVQVVDRDGFPVRTLVNGAAAARGENRWSWDGRDDAGEVVPDEAYSLRVDWRRGTEREIYFPADAPAHLSSVDAEYYAPRTGTIVYTLPVPSRVHLQAGVASKNPKTGVMEGPVMKTVVNREPRAAGRIAEPWTGLDESGLVKVPDLKDFVLAVATVPLPASSVITYGNRVRTFAESALTRQGRSLFTAANRKGTHHAGLSVLEDVSPSMRIEPLNASWSSEQRAWLVAGRKLRLRVSLSGPSAATFAAQKGQIQRFVDGKLVSQTERPSTYPAVIEVRLPSSNGVRNVSLNWQSDHGAVAANTIRVRGIRP